MTAPGAADFQIRRLRSDDADRLGRFLRSLSQQTTEFYQPYGFDPAAAVEIALRSEQPDQFHLVAIRDENGREDIVAHAFLWKTNTQDPLLGICVTDAHQGKGLGSRLVERLVRRTLMMGKPSLRLTVFPRNLRAQHVYTKLGFGLVGTAKDGQMIMERRLPAPALAVRIAYVHPIPWGLQGLTPDTWPLDAWKRHVDLLRSVGATGLKIYLWPQHFYHPEHPDTLHNQWRYRVYADALRYARDAGLKTFVGFAFNTAPPSVYLRYPALRAWEGGYTGMHLCWSRGKAEILPFQTYLIEHFATVADGFFLWLLDPGLCLCPDCADQGAVLQDALETYLGRVAAVGVETRLHLMAWQLEALMRGAIAGATPDPQVASRLLARLPQGAMVAASDPVILQTARERGHVPVHFDITLDPEGGLEDRALFPVPLLSEIDGVVARIVEGGWAGAIGYRLTPATRVASDYVFFRKLAQPGTPAADLIHEMGSMLFASPSAGEDFTEANLRLEEWWRERAPADLLQASRLLERSLESCHPQDRPLVEPAAHWADVLFYLANFMYRLDSASNEGERDALWRSLADNLYRRMRGKETFRAFTADQVWAVRAQEMIGQRARWWIRWLRETAHGG